MLCVNWPFTAGLNYRIKMVTLNNASDYHANRLGLGLAVR